MYLSNMAAVDPSEAEQLQDQFLTSDSREFMAAQEAQVRALEERMEAKRREREEKERAAA